MITLKIDRFSNLNKQEIAKAEKDAKVMSLQNSQVTENTLKLKKLEVLQSMINKWNGQMPSTMMGENINTLFGLNQQKYNRNTIEIIVVLTRLTEYSKISRNMFMDKATKQNDK